MPIWLQSWKPAWHESTAHAPALHTALAWASCPQSIPHAPQFLMSMAVFASHPSLGLALQSAKPALQVTPQFPPVQVAVWLAPALHILPHAPQLRMSVSTFT